MNLKSLRIFVYVIEEGTLARASQRLNLSQPAASRLLSLLEQEIGTTLFFREKKRLIPTPEGDLFYPEAIRILASIEGIPDFLQQVQQATTAPFRIICHPSLVNALVLPTIARLAAIRPDIRVNIEVTPRRNLGRPIARELFDVGLGTLPIPSENLEAKYVYQSPLRVILPKGHPLADRPELSTTELVQLPYIALAAHTRVRKIVDSELLAEGAVLIPHHEVFLGSIATRMVLMGLGFAFSDPLTIEADLRDRLCFVPWTRAPIIEHGVFMPKTRSSHTANDDFITCIQATVDEAMSYYSAD